MSADEKLKRMKDELAYMREQQLNERLRQLAIEAGMHNMGISLIIGIEEYHQKFAELIIRECAEIARLNTRVDSKVYLMILEHFGIGMSTEDKKTLIKELLGVKND